MKEYRKITINLPNNVYEKLVKIMMNNRIENSKKGLTGSSKNSETLSALISNILEKGLKHYGS